MNVNELNADVYNRNNGLTRAVDTTKGYTPQMWADMQARSAAFWKTLPFTQAQYVAWYNTLSPAEQQKANTQFFQAQGAWAHPDSSFEKAAGPIALMFSLGGLGAAAGGIAGAGGAGAASGSGAGWVPAGLNAYDAYGGLAASGAAGGSGAALGDLAGATLADWTVTAPSLAGTGASAGVGAGIGTGAGMGISSGGYNYGGLQANSAYQGGVTDTGAIMPGGEITVTPSAAAGGTGLTAGQVAGGVAGLGLVGNALAGGGGATGGTNALAAGNGSYNMVGQGTATGTGLEGGAGAAGNTVGQTASSVGLNGGLASGGSGMGWLDYLNTAGNIYSAISGSNAAKDAAATSAAASERAAKLQYDMFMQQRADQMPFLQGGYDALAREKMLLGLSGDKTDPAYGSMAKSFGMSDFQEDPGYQFRLSEGLKALDKQAAARGGLISGAALKAASGFAGQQASDEYQNAYNRYNANRLAILNPLQAMSGQGQTSANALGTAASGYAANAGNAYQNAGNATASGYIGSQNAINNGISSVSNYFNQQRLMQQMFPNGVNG